MMSWFLFKIELLHILRIFPSRRQALSCTNPPATGLILLLQATQDFVMDCVWFKTNGADCSQVPEALQRLCPIPRQALEPFSFSTKELVEYWQYRGIWEEVGLIELIAMSRFRCYENNISYRFLSLREHYQSTIWTSKRKTLVFSCHGRYIPTLADSLPLQNFDTDSDFRDLRPFRHFIGVIRDALPDQIVCFF